jgi:hypothetical protein
MVESGGVSCPFLFILSSWQSSFYAHLVDTSLLEPEAGTQRDRVDQRLAAEARC